MRLFLPPLMLLASASASAQTLPDLDKRVTKLEREVGRVAKRVLPKNEQTVIEPEVSSDAPAPAAAPPTPPASAASVSELGERVGAIERRQRELTSQVEDQGNRLRLAEERLTKFQADAEARMGKLEGTAPAGPPSAVAPAPAGTPPPISPPAPDTAKSPAAKPTAAATPTAAPSPATAEARYKAAYALVEAKKWPEAETALQAFVEKSPKDKLASNARYWLGRTYYNEGKFDPAAREHFDNYKADPKGERAQESLFWVGRSLMRLKRTKEACQVYDLAAQVYATDVKPEMRPQFTAARKTAGCR